MQAYVEGLRPWAEDAREQFHKVEPEMEASQRNLAAAYRSTVGHFRVMGLEDWLDLAVYLLAEQAGGAGAYAKSLELVLYFDKRTHGCTSHRMYGRTSWVRHLATSRGSLQGVDWLLSHAR